MIEMMKKQNKKKQVFFWKVKTPKKETWKSERRKAARIHGKGYFRKADGEHTQHRQMGPLCMLPYCRQVGLQCGEVTEREQAEVFDRFWRMSTWDKKRTFLQSSVDATTKQGQRQRVRNTWRLKLEDGRAIVICRKLMSSTLGVAESTLYSWLKRVPRAGCSNSKAAKTGPHAPKTTEVEEAHRWLQRLPTMESHYCHNIPMYREKRFLEPGHTIARLHREYQRVVREEGRSPVGITTFRNLFAEKGFSVFTPRKDRCKMCVGAETGNLPREAVEEHWQLAKAARAEKEADEQLAAEDPSISVWTMDLQAVIICPQSSASTMYYKRKLKVRNMVYFEKKTKEASNFLWDETDAEISQEVFAYIHKRHFGQVMASQEYNGVQKLIVWSDNCGYQTKNAAVAGAFRDLAMSHNITVVQKYLVPGHSMMECDSIHTTIQHSMPPEVFTPRDVEVAISAARANPSPYRVTRLHHEDFSVMEPQAIRDLRPRSKLRDPCINEMREIEYTASGQVRMRTDFRGEWIPLPAGNFCRVPVTWRRLYDARLPISNVLFRDLQDLKAVIPLEHHGFYDQLPCRETDD